MAMIAVGAAATLLAGGALWWGLRRPRLRRYRELAEQQRRLGPAPALAAEVRVTPWESHLAILPRVVEPVAFRALVAAAEQAATDHERSWVPGHKQGGTIAYEHLHAALPMAVAFYQSAALAELLQAVTGLRLRPTPLHDQSSCSLLCYKQPRDRIGWHFDHNFYRGRHVTVLLVLANHRHAAPERSSDCHLEARPGESWVSVLDRPNTLIVFEGARVRHRATALGPDQTRILLSMTFATDVRAWPWTSAVRRIKDTAFFGVRALWS